MYAREIGSGGKGWIHLALNSDQWQISEHGNRPSGSIK